MINKGCPGLDSEKSGYEKNCDGCPNQQICQSKKNFVSDSDLNFITSRLKNVNKIILVLSGKGGVGKSTISSTLSKILASDESKQVGLLDLDICGPSQPKMMNLEGEPIHKSGLGWEPVYVSDNLGVMSTSFFLENKNSAIIWHGLRKNTLIKDFLMNTNWGDYLDYLIIDTPPGTSDEHISLIHYLKNLNLTGALIVTTPQEISLLDVRKEIDFCNKTKTKILGMVENMSKFVCPNCKNEFNIFKPTTGGAKQLCLEKNISFLGSIPLDPEILRLCDSGSFDLSINTNSKSINCFKFFFENCKRIFDL